MRVRVQQCLGGKSNWVGSAIRPNRIHADPAQGERFHVDCRPKQGSRRNFFVKQCCPQQLSIQHRKSEHALKDEQDPAGSVPVVADWKIFCHLPILSVRSSISLAHRLAEAAYLSGTRGSPIPCTDRKNTAQFGCASRMRSNSGHATRNCHAAGCQHAPGQDS